MSAFPATTVDAAFSVGQSGGVHSKQWHVRRYPDGNAFWCAPQARRVAGRKSRQTSAKATSANDTIKARAAVTAE